VFMSTRLQRVFAKGALGRVIALVLEVLGAEEQALRWVDRSLKWVSEPAQVHLQATRLCLKRGRVDQAIWHWRKAVGEEQSKASLLYWLKRTNYLPDSPAYLVSFPGKLNSYVPHGRLDSCVLLFNLSLVLSKTGCHQKALEYYQLLQAEGMNTVELLNNKGYNLYHLGRYEEAVLCYELAREMVSGNGLLLTNLAACYQRLKIYPQAINHYEAALQGAADDPITLNNYACCLVEIGRSEEALELYNRALVVSPGNKTFLLNKAVCLFILQRNKDSMTICDQVLAQEPYCFEAWGLRGNLLNVTGQSKEAAVCYSRALGLAC